MIVPFYISRNSALRLISGVPHASQGWCHAAHFIQFVSTRRDRYDGGATAFRFSSTIADDPNANETPKLFGFITGFGSTPDRSRMPDARDEWMCGSNRCCTHEAEWGGGKNCDRL